MSSLTTAGGRTLAWHERGSGSPLLCHPGGPGCSSAYYADLPKARTAPTTYDETLPALVRVGDPLRNIAPCISCHGGVDQKLGTPWLEGMPKSYLVAQLGAFAAGVRRNDSQAQMRNMARAMTPREIQEVAAFYARKAGSGERRP